MRKTILICLLVCSAHIIHAQLYDSYRVIDSTFTLNRLWGPVTRGTLIKTSTTNFFEINDNVNRVLPTHKPLVVVYGYGEKYIVRIEGIDSLLNCSRVREVIESNIDGDFKGWDGTSTFKLTNLQEWKQDHVTPNISVKLYRPPVIIYLTMYGYKMKIEGLNEDAIFVKKVN